MQNSWGAVVPVFLMFRQKDTSNAIISDWKIVTNCKPNGEVAC